LGRPPPADGVRVGTGGMRAAAGIWLGPGMGVDLEHLRAVPGVLRSPLPRLLRAMVWFAARPARVLVHDAATHAAPAVQELLHGAQKRCCGGLPDLRALTVDAVSRVLRPDLEAGRSRTVRRSHEDLGRQFHRGTDDGRWPARPGHPEAGRVAVDRPSARAPAYRSILKHGAAEVDVREVSRPNASQPVFTGYLAWT
jgi:hypothetical protein